jgi:protein disulfide-isomerase A6
MNRMFLLSLSVALILINPIVALYGAKSDVISATDKNFKEEVLKSGGIVIVEFFAPWCGHCKSLAPEYEKAASALKGVVKVVAVDATVSPSLQSKYGVEGFPSIKIFGQDKKKPVDYNGARTSDAMISECMKAANKLVKDRKKSPSAPSGKATLPPATTTGTSKGKGGPKVSEEEGEKKPKRQRESGGGSAVVELTEANFNALVMESTEHWLVEFYAPWCGHCKNLEPEWESAAKSLKGSVKLGNANSNLNTNPYTNPNTNPYTNPYTNTNTNTNSYHDPNTDSNCNPNPNCKIR